MEDAQESVTVYEILVPHLDKSVDSPPWPLEGEIGREQVEG